MKAILLCLLFQMVGREQFTGPILVFDSALRPGQPHTAADLAVDTGDSLPHLCSHRSRSDRPLACPAPLENSVGPVVWQSRVVPDSVPASAHSTPAEMRPQQALSRLGTAVPAPLPGILCPGDGGDRGGPSHRAETKEHLPPDSAPARAWTDCSWCFWGFLSVICLVFANAFQTLTLTVIIFADSNILGCGLKNHYLMIL